MSRANYLDEEIDIALNRNKDRRKKLHVDNDDDTFSFDHDEGREDDEENVDTAENGNPDINEVDGEMMETMKATVVGEEKESINIDEVRQYTDQENVEPPSTNYGEEETPVPIDNNIYQQDMQSHGYTTDDGYDSARGQYENESIDGYGDGDYSSQVHNRYEEYDHNISPDWRSLQQEYLLNRGQKEKSSNHSVRDRSPAPRLRSSSRDVEENHVASDRLYRHAMEMKRRKDARYKWKKRQEERVVEPKLNLVTKKTDHMRPTRERSSSTPRYLHLYDQRIVKERKERLREKEKLQFMKENNQLRLSTRSMSRPRASSAGPRGLHLYEQARMKQKKIEEEKKERERRERKKSVNTPERINRLYEMSRRSQQIGRQRRVAIESSRKQPKRSISVGARRKVTEPLDVGLYDRGMAKLRALEARRAKAAKVRDDENYKESPILSTKF